MIQTGHFTQIQREWSREKIAVKGSGPHLQWIYYTKAKWIKCENSRKTFTARHLQWIFYTGKQNGWLIVVA